MVPGKYLLMLVIPILNLYYRLINSIPLVKLESNRTDGFFCESWDNTDAHGITVLPPIHMGMLKLIVKAKGFKKQEIEVPANSLGDPVRVTLRSK